MDSTDPLGFPGVEPIWNSLKLSGWADLYLGQWFSTLDVFRITQGVVKYADINLELNLGN